MALKLTPELQAVDAQLRAVNRKLVNAAKTFGVQSPQYGYLESLVTSIYTGPDQLRTNKAGVLQVARTARNVRVSSMAEEQKIISKVTTQYSIREHKQRLLHDWAARQAGTDGDPDALLSELTQKRKQQIVQQESHFYSVLQTSLQTALNKVYNASRQSKQNRKTIERIRRESKGRWTDRDTLQSWLTELTSTLGREGKKIAADFARQTGVSLT